MRLVALYRPVAQWQRPSVFGALILSRFPLDLPCRHVSTDRVRRLLDAKDNRENSAAGPTPSRLQPQQWGAWPPIIRSSMVMLRKATAAVDLADCNQTVIAALEKIGGSSGGEAQRFAKVKAGRRVSGRGKGGESSHKEQVRGAALCARCFNCNELATLLRTACSRPRVPGRLAKGRCLFVASTGNNTATGQRMLS